MKSLFIAWAAIAFVSQAAAEDCHARIEGAHIPEPPPGAAVAALYFRVHNDCDRPLSIIGAESEQAANMSLHQSSESHGIARMEAIDRVDVPVGENRVFRPGGLHLMLRGAEPSVESNFLFTLLFEDGTRLLTRADVVPRRSNPPSQAGNQNHHSMHHSGVHP